YSFVTLGALQALLYYVQESRIKHHADTRLLELLPPLETMESSIFKLVTIGFVLLSVTVLSGVFFSQQLFGSPFEFNHHNVLAVAGWIAIAVVLSSRVLFKLRGSQSMRWVLGGFVCIQLSYFGTKLIFEILG
ncbi:MAG: cytochrome c biogenesis protein CcsA, partial [Pseudomonadota bacterium]